MKITSHRDLIVWQKAIELTEKIYEITKSLPTEEQFGLISQMRRCAVSIPSNIAEGRSRGTKKEYSQFLRISLGSCAELETQLLLMKKIYGPKNTEGIRKIENLLQEVGKMINSMIRKLSS